MPLLYYWRRDNYISDLSYVRLEGVRLQQNSAAFGSLTHGERVWAITRARDGKYVVAAQVRVDRMTEDPEGKYGRFVLEPLAGSSILYDVERSPTVEPVVRRLSIDAGATILGHSFQGPAAARRISMEDDQQLAEFADSLGATLRQPVALPHPQAVDIGDPGLPQRHQVKTWRIVRDTRTVRRLKALYENACQICGCTLESELGWSYSEGHHVRPLGGVHNGPDDSSNIIILCPNHHALCDFGALQLDMGTLRLHPEHQLQAEFVQYHNTAIFRGPTAG